MFGATLSNIAPEAIRSNFVSCRKGIHGKLLLKKSSFEMNVFILQRNVIYWFLRIKNDEYWEQLMIKFNLKFWEMLISSNSNQSHFCANDIVILTMTTYLFRFLVTLFDENISFFLTKMINHLFAPWHFMYLTVTFRRKSFLCVHEKEKIFINKSLFWCYEKPTSFIRRIFDYAVFLALI